MTTARDALQDPLLTRNCSHQFSSSRSIIDFRNLLAHQYGAIDDDSVFGLVYSDLIILKSEVAQLLCDLFGAD